MFRRPKMESRVEAGDGGGAAEVKGREVFNIGPQYVVGGAVGLEALGTSVLKSLQSLFRKGRSFMSP